MGSHEELCWRGRASGQNSKAFHARVDMRPTIPIGVPELLIVGVIGLLLWRVYRFTRSK